MKTPIRNLMLNTGLAATLIFNACAPNTPPAHPHEQKQSYSCEELPMLQQAHEPFDKHVTQLYNRTFSSKNLNLNLLKEYNTKLQQSNDALAEEMQAHSNCIEQIQEQTKKSYQPLDPGLHQF